MTDQQFSQHVRLLENIEGATVGVRQLLERLIDISNTNLDENGQSKQLLRQVLRALEK